MPQLTLDDGVGDEEDRCVVAHHVPVAFFGVKFQGETAHASLCIGGAELAGHRREAGQHFRLFPDRGKDLGFGVFRDVVGDGKRAMNSPALVMDHTLGNSFAVLVGDLFDQLIILHQERAAGSGSDCVLVVGNRAPAVVVNYLNSFFNAFTC